MPGYDLSGLNVLVAEDNEFMRKILVRMLHGLGVGTVHAVENGQEAVTLLGKFAPDILFTDWLMEPLDGLALLRWVRQSEHSPNRYLPIVMVTGYTDRRRVFQARDAGVHEFLVKPFSVKALATRIESIIERPRPFIRSPDYFGPDRRRRQDPHYSGPERRAALRDAAAVEEVVLDAG